MAGTTAQRVCIPTDWFRQSSAREYAGGHGSDWTARPAYGFPADYLLTSEVARSVVRDNTERLQLSDAMLPAMLGGGFTSATSGSVVIASVLVSFI
ncbi:hypothetical protein [Arthrobacter pigmenti]